MIDRLQSEVRVILLIVELLLLLFYSWQLSGELDRPTILRHTGQHDGPTQRPVMSHDVNGDGICSSFY